MRAIHRSRQYLIPFAGAAGKGAQQPFPLDQFLKDKLIVGIEFFDERTLTFGDNGQPIVTNADFLKMSVTLVHNSVEIYKGTPLSQLNPLDQWGIWKELAPTRVSFQQSVLKVNDTLTAIQAFSVGAVVHYLDQ